MTDRPGMDADPEEGTSPASGWLFWVFAALATAVFAPCVILPAWRDYQSARVIEQLAEAEVQSMQLEVERQERLASALRNDPAVIARAAQRDFEYRKPDEVCVPVRVNASSADSAEPVRVAPVQPPGPMRRWLARLPHRNYDALFCDPPTRRVIMALAGGLVLAAFWLFPPHRPPRQHATPNPGTRG